MGRVMGGGGKLGNGVGGGRDREGETDKRGEGEREERRRREKGEEKEREKGREGVKDGERARGGYYPLWTVGFLGYRASNSSGNQKASVLAST